MAWYLGIGVCKDTVMTELVSGVSTINTLTPYMVLLLFATRFAACAGDIRVSFIQP